MIQWAREAANKGYSKLQISDALLKKGLNRESVSELIASLPESKQLPSLKTQMQNPRSHKVWWAGLIIILIVASVVTLVFTGKLNLDFAKKAQLSQSITQNQNQITQQKTEQQKAVEKQDETVRNLNRASGTLKDLGNTF